jgi:hypothetical protein
MVQSASSIAGCRSAIADLGLPTGDCRLLAMPIADLPIAELPIADLPICDCRLDC